MRQPHRKTEHHYPVEACEGSGAAVTETTEFASSPQLRFARCPSCGVLRLVTAGKLVGHTRLT